MFFPYHDDNPTRRLPLVTGGLIAINALAFLWSLVLSPLGQLEFVYEHGFVPVRLARIASDEAIEIPVGPAEAEHGPQPDNVVVVYQPAPLAVLATLFTSMFLHGGWMHLLGNMWFLWLFGNNVEDRLGHVVYLLFYLAGGLVAALCHWLTDLQSPVPVIGASGAVSAVLGGYAVTWPHARIRALVFLFIIITTIEVPALVVLGFWFVQQLLEAYTAFNVGMDGGVAWWAHVGGFAAGAAAMKPLCALIAPPAPLTPRVESPRRHLPY